MLTKKDRKFIREVLSRFDASKSFALPLSLEGAQISRLLQLGYLNPECFQSTGSFGETVPQFLYYKAAYPITEKCLEEYEKHILVRIKDSPWSLIVVFIMALASLLGTYIK
jgi:hypothetical protein